MKSYATIDRIENQYAVCELELIDVQESQQYPILCKNTTMVDIPYEAIFLTIGEVQEGDIIVVEQNNGSINFVYSKDDAEKSRRIEQLIAIRRKKQS